MLSARAVSIDHVLLAVDHRPGIVELEQARARTGGVGGDRLVTQVKTKPAGARMADHPREQQGGRREWQVGIPRQIAVVVEHRRSRRTFDAGKIELGMDRKGGRSTHDQARDGQPPFQQPVAQRERALQARLGGMSPLGQIGVMDVAVVGMQAVGDQVGQLVDQGIELGRRLARLNPGPAHPDLQVDQHRNRRGRALARRPTSARAESG